MTRSLLRIALGGLACAAVVLAAGWSAERIALGGRDADARVRVETEAREAFDTMARAVESMAAGVTDPATVRAAAAGDTVAARRLFTQAEAALGVDEAAEVALTVYGADGQPLAWAGRPSELPRERLQGGEAWFPALGALGLRLVFVAPVVDGSTRLGTIAAERSIVPTVEPPRPAASLADRDADVFRFPVRRVPLTIQLPFGDASTRGNPDRFDILAPSGDRLLTASLAPADLEQARVRWRRARVSIALMVLAATMVLLIGPLIDWRNLARGPLDHVGATLLAAAAILAARLLLRASSPADWLDASVFSAAYASPLFAPFLSSPFDFVATSVAAGGLVALLAFTVENWRLGARRWRGGVWSPGRLGLYLAAQTTAGAVAGAVLLAHDALLRDTIAHTTLDLVHFSLQPWNGARIALQVGVLVAHATVAALAVVLLRAAQAPWRVSRRDWRLRLATAACWVLPLVAWELSIASGNGHWPLWGAAAVIAALATFAPWLKSWHRHSSQAFRLTLLALGLAVPAFAFYPTLFESVREARSQLVETVFAPEAINLRQTVHTQLERSLAEIDRFPDLGALIAAKSEPADDQPLTDPYRAFQVWQLTSLAESLLTSSVELYGPDGQLASRFAFSLPEDLTATPRSDERACRWDVYEEVSPFFTEERRVLKAGRVLCGPGGDAQPLGSIVVHAMVDYENLPFISSRSPYVELLRPADRLRGEDALGREVEFAFYGWSGRPLYSSRETAWELDDLALARMAESREPFWTRLRRGVDDYDVYLLNDRGGIYALGVPVVAPLDHSVNLAELSVLAVGTYVLLLGANGVFAWLGRRRTSGRGLIRELRASFYRKLFIAFVLAVSLPVAALAVIARNYFKNEITAGVEQEAVRTASAARRVVEDLVGPRGAQQAGLDDNLMVWVSRLIDQDVNVFSGPRLLATSERNLFASGVLPTRTPAPVYRELELQNQAATVMRERVRALEYLVAATPLTARQANTTLTVPLTSRQREIDEQIDTLDRRVLLGALLFILAGAVLGYSMAERISDPVSRLTRATRRIARGDLDARIASTSSDELRRLVEDFNQMADDLKRQRQELERTHRVEAWAEMARQVAHEIKNPLTPIQLNAEHLRRVHSDRGEPLGPMVQDCVATILTQVKLLRQIASEFSSFASSPTARPSRVGLPELLNEIVEPYRRGLEGRISFQTDLPATLPPVHVDRTLIARTLTNLVENALHAMPGTGTLTIVAHDEGDVVRLRVSDTGVGMDAEALSRAFEPYFSTKTTGTGLGLPLAKRNVELSGGTIAIWSDRDKGTTVELTLPALRDASRTA